jgi:hypothetical protein
MKLIKRAVVLSTVVMILTSCSFIATVPTPTSVPTNPFIPVSTNMPEPTSTPTATFVPQYTKTAKPSTVVESQDGKLFISHEYGFSILIPAHDSQGVVYNRADYFPEILSADLAEIDLDDGGDIFPMFHIAVEDQTESCHPWLTNSDGNPVTMAQTTLGGISFNKVHTPDLDEYEMQAIEYMTYSTDLCVHFFISLTLYYFDRPIDAEPPRDMLPYIQNELDRIISTFQWSKP